MLSKLGHALFSTILLLFVATITLVAIGILVTATVILYETAPLSVFIFGVTFGIVFTIFIILS